MLSSRDLARLFAVLSSPPRRCEDAAQVVELILLTGCRSGEILRLRWDEVHADRLELRQTKTGARTVLLNDLAIAALARLQRRSACVFPSPIHPGHPRAQIDSPWKRIKARAELPPTLRLHDLRHTYASHAMLAMIADAVTAPTPGMVCNNRTRASSLATSLSRSSYHRSRV